jgi:uncharacterized membrane protein YbjE (DUF340 family)
MFLTLLPFICMGTGLFIGFQKLSDKVYRAFDKCSTVALILLMFVIGGNVGTSREVIAEIGVVGINCIITCLCAVFGSVFLCLLIEKTIVPLGRYQELLHEESEENAALAQAEESENKRKIDPILIIIIVSVFVGIFVCYEWMPQTMTWTLTYALWISLIVLYTSVGVGMGQQKSVFLYMKKVGFKIVFFAVGVLLGSMAGGALSTFITGMPLKYAVISTSGVGYYSLTGATMLSTFGAEGGVYGFMVNVFRDITTVSLLPLFSRMSKSAPMASGAAGCMDTMLVPVTRAMGRELGLIALIVGVILTFAVPVLLPILCSIF